MDNGVSLFPSHDILNLNSNLKNYHIFANILSIFAHQSILPYYYVCNTHSRYQMQNNQVLPEMTMLVQRQEKILQQLNDLKRQMTVLKAELKIPKEKLKISVSDGTTKKNIEVSI